MFVIVAITGRRVVAVYGRGDEDPFTWAEASEMLPRLQARARQLEPDVTIDHVICPIAAPPIQ